VRTLVLNTGSSTLKASALDGARRDPLATETLSWGDDATRATGRREDLVRLLERFAVDGVPVGSFEAVGHRVVHGGERFTRPVEVDEAVLAELEGLTDLAPLHNPVAIDTLRAAREVLPDVPHVAVFDTAFHATLDEPARTYALPAAWRGEHGLRRFGFHGLSVAWSVRRAGELLGSGEQDLGLVVAHLGSGCSVTAVADGVSVWTSMGMTPLEGLVMGTRSGSVDPGVLLRLLRAGVGIEELADGLEHQAGLLGLSEATADMRTLLASEHDGDEAAELAVEVFVRRAAEGIASAATALPALDALVFTGGIGEHAGAVRARIVERLGVLGLRGPLAEGGGGADAVLTESGQTPAVLRVEAREDLIIASEVAAVLR
jgi:acetate kinase